VLTGDYRGETTGPYTESLKQLKATRSCLGEKVYAVLGNHDNVELVLSLPELGIQVLMNEAISLEKDGASLTLAGVDDSHFYKGHHFDFLDSEADEVTLLLSHSPEAWKEAERAGVDLQLSGHTHGGQLCLPGGIPVVCHLNDCPRSMVKGRWQEGRLQGYTSRGIGSSTLDIRLNCPPEITLHTLRCS
jgi:predicted MPP superfamily phosphohydrolase